MEPVTRRRRNRAVTVERLLCAYVAVLSIGLLGALRVVSQPTRMATATTRGPIVLTWVPASLTRRPVAGRGGSILTVSSTGHVYKTEPLETLLYRGGHDDRQTLGVLVERLSDLPSDFWRSFWNSSSWHRVYGREAIMVYTIPRQGVVDVMVRLDSLLTSVEGDGLSLESVLHACGGIRPTHA